MENVEVSRRMFCDRLIATLVGGSLLVVAGCGSGGGTKNPTSNSTINDFSNLEKSVSPSTDLRTYLAGKYSVAGVPFDFSSGALSQGVVGQVVDNVSGSLQGTVGNYFNSAKNLTDAEKEKYLSDLVLETPGSGYTFTCSFEPNSTTDFNGSLSVINNIKQVVTNQDKASLTLTWKASKRSQIRPAVFQSYVDSGLFDPAFVTRIKLGQLAIYTDTIEISGINLVIKFHTYTRSQEELGLKGTLFLVSDHLNYTVTQNATSDASVTMEASSPIVIATNQSSGSSLITTKATDLSILGIDTQKHYAKGENVTLEAFLRTRDAQPVQGMPIVLSLYYIHKNAPLPDKYIAYNSVTDANGKATFKFQIPLTDEDYSMVATFDGSATYNASHSYDFTVLVGD